LDTFVPYRPAPPLLHPTPPAPSPLSLHDALPIWVAPQPCQRRVVQQHHGAVAAHADVDLDPLDPGVQRGTDRGERVLARTVRLAVHTAVGDDAGKPVAHAGTSTWASSRRPSR